MEITGQRPTKYLQDITQEALKRAVSYDEDSGKFTLLIGSHKRKVGEPAEYEKGGYRILSIPGMGGAGRGQYKSHRAVWLYVTGKWPDGDIDHIDGNGLNNRFDNLREVTRSVNCRNQVRRSSNKTGISGVSWCNAYKFGKRWRVVIANKERGRFETLLDAVAERLRAMREIGGYTERHGTE